MQGLLPNSRMIQGIFDDENPQTRRRWDTPDATWDPARNTDAFVAAMPAWRAHGLLAFTLGMQGGNPEGYSQQQLWLNSAYRADGSLKRPYLDRLAKILNEADRLGMVCILSLFYFGQDQTLQDEAAVIRALDNTIDWLGERGDRHVIIEVANECDHPKYVHDILRPDRIHTLISRVKDRSQNTLYAGTSFCGGVLPSPQILQESDLIFIHGNGVHDPEKLRELIRKVRLSDHYRNQPVVINEDDHFNFQQAENNFLAATDEKVSWGYFDYRIKGETALEQGYQSLPCDWGISSPRKKAFFKLLSNLTRENPKK